MEGVDAMFSRTTDDQGGWIFEQSSMRERERDVAIQKNSNGTTAIECPTNR